jgi:chaperonin GroES
MTINPIGDRVVATKAEAPKTTASGLVLPSDAKEKPAYAVVEAVGHEVKNIKKGDKIVYQQYAPTEVKLDGTEYLIIKAEDVLATLA